MGEINRDHQERMLRLPVSGEFKAVNVSTKKAADARAEEIEDLEIDYADLLSRGTNRQAALSLAAR